MKKPIHTITWSQLRAQSPIKAGKLILQLEKCRVKKTNQNLSKDFGANDITKYITNKILNN